MSDGEPNGEPDGAPAALPPVLLYRIATDTPDYAADDRDGTGAKRAGGRWNRPGTALLYAATSRPLACLETLVHLARRTPFPFNRYLVEVAVPGEAWAARTVFDPGAHVGWDVEPPGTVSLDWGDGWARGRRTLLAAVPSVVVPEDANVLVNPAHPDHARVVVRKVRRWLYNPRLR